MNRSQQRKVIACVPAMMLFLAAQTIRAGSATWNLNPGSGDWNTATNWTPATVPNSGASTATFASSTVTNVSISALTDVNGIVFNAGASAFTITASALPGDGFDNISGVGITNNSGITQNFATTVDGSANTTPILFTNSATAGSLTAFTNSGATVSGGGGGSTEFHDTSSAASGTFTNNGSSISGALDRKS